VTVADKVPAKDVESIAAVTAWPLHGQASSAFACWSRVGLCALVWELPFSGLRALLFSVPLYR